MIIDSNHSAGMKVALLVADAKSAQEENLAERRREERYPLFRPVNVIQPDGSETAAFSRDISSFDIGLVHNEPLPQVQVVLRMTDDTGECVELKAEITWNRKCGPNWYLSGASFTE